MTKFDEIPPTPYSRTDTAEVTAIAVLEMLLDKTHIKADLKKRDKMPNIDGSIEVVDDNQHPQGTIFVQVKPLDTEASKTKSFSCKIGFLAYCSQSTVPVLLIGVDIRKNQAFWLHISRELLTSLSLDDKQHKSVRFPDENLIDGCNESYVAQWRFFCLEYRKRFIYFDQLAAERDKLINELDIVRAEAEALGDITAPEYPMIQEFLDELNSQLGSTFSIVKERYYPSIRRLGIAYRRDSREGLSYALFPIQKGENELEIRKLPSGGALDLFNVGVALRSGPRRVKEVRYSRSSTILKAPTKAAREMLGKWTLKLIEQKGLRLDNELLAREIIFSAVDRLYVALGLTKKDEYQISELTNAFEKYLPLWTERSLELHGDVPLIILSVFEPDGAINVDTLLISTTEENRTVLASQVHADLISGRLAKLPSGIVAPRLFLGIVRRQLEYLQCSNLSVIRRLYRQPDHVPESPVGSPLELWTDRAVCENFSLIFNNLKSVYDNIIRINFPGLVSELRFFRDFDRKIIILQRSSFGYRNDWELESWEFIGPASGQLDFFCQNSTNLPTNLHFEAEEIILEGQPYRPDSTESRLVQTDFKAHPMLDIVMEELHKRFSAVLADWTEK